MGRLAGMIPSRFAQECATEGFVSACSGALKELANAADAKTAAGVLGALASAAAGPAMYLAIYAGGAILQWKADRRREEAAKARFRELHGAIARVEGGVRDQKELAGLLGELLERDGKMRKRFEEAEKKNQDPKEAVALVLEGLHSELGIEESFEHIRVYLSNISEWVVETRDNTRRLIEGQKKQATKDDLSGLVRKEDLDEYFDRKLAEIDQRQKTGGAQAPPLTDEDRRVLDEARAHGDAKAKAQAAIMQRDFVAADPLIERVVERAAGELFDALTLKGDRHYYAGEFDAAIEPYEQAMALRPNDVRARNNATIAHTFARLGSIEGHQKRAIEIGEGTLRMVAEGSQDWAATQNNLGNALRGQASASEGSERARLLGEAVAAYRAALTVYTRAALPQDWAMTQNNLGNAYADLPTGERGENLKKAIAAYESALEVYTREAHPVDWALTQNNLGTAYLRLPAGDRGKNLKKAIAKFESALEVRTRDDLPVGWALTQYNLGTAYQSLPTGDQGENLSKAIAAYESALEAYTRDAHPVDWAKTQYNLGTAYLSVPAGDRRENLARAIAAFESALDVSTRQTHPVDWARTQNNLGVAYESQPTGDRGENLGRAIAAYESALEVSTRGAHPVDWAMTQGNLGNAYQSLPTGDRAGNFAWAIAAYKSALEVYTREAHPVDWARTQNNLAIALWNLSEVPGQDRCALIRQAISSVKGVLTVYTADAFPLEQASGSKSLEIGRAAYESAGCTPPFDEIPPAE